MDSSKDASVNSSTVYSTVRSRKDGVTNCGFFVSHLQPKERGRDCCEPLTGLQDVSTCGMDLSSLLSLRPRLHNFKSWDKGRGGHEVLRKVVNPVVSNGLYH